MKAIPMTVTASMELKIFVGLFQTVDSTPAVEDGTRAAARNRGWRWGMWRHGLLL